MGDDPIQPRWKPHRLPGFNYSDPDHAFFVTIRARPGTAPFSEPRLATAVLDSLNWLRSNRGMQIYAYCLMPDHVHLLLRLAGGSPTLGVVLGSFKRFTTRQSWLLGYTGALWQGGYHDRILRRSEDGRKVAAYILANPVRKGLIGQEHEYPYSGTPDPM